MKKIGTLLFVIAILGLVILLIYKLFYYKNCTGKEYFKNISFEGVVTAKYLDHKQHSIPVIGLINQNTKQVHKIDFFLDVSNSYEKINISDFITKKAGSMDIYIVKNNKSSFLTKVNFSCQD